MLFSAESRSPRGPEERQPAHRVPRTVRAAEKATGESRVQSDRREGDLEHRGVQFGSQGPTFDTE